MEHHMSISRFAVSLGLSVCFAAPLLAQTPAAGAPKNAKVKKTWSVPRTPWGDPDVAGVYTNNDESGIPFERPAQFEGKRLSDISENELNDLRAERNQQALERAPQL